MRRSQSSRSLSLRWTPIRAAENHRVTVPSPASHAARGASWWSYVCRSWRRSLVRRRSTFREGLEHDRNRIGRMLVRGAGDRIDADTDYSSDQDIASQPSRTGARELRLHLNLLGLIAGLGKRRDEFLVALDDKRARRDTTEPIAGTHFGLARP